MVFVGAKVHKAADLQNDWTRKRLIFADISEIICTFAPLCQQNRLKWASPAVR